MTNELKYALTNNNNLFRDLSNEDITAMVNLTTKKSIPSKTTFIEQGEKSDVIYIILSGSVSIFRLNEDGEEINLSILGVGEIIGEMSLIDNQPRSAFARTLTDSEFLVISHKQFSELLSKHSSIAINLLRLFSLRLRQINNHMEEIRTQNLETRTLSTIKTLKKYFSNGTITLSHEELATIIGATRSRVTKTLDKLEKKGLLELSNRKITLL